MARAALSGGLVDRVGDRRAFEARLAELGGRCRRRGARVQAGQAGSYVNDVVDRKPTGPIGIVTIAGMIVDGKAGPGTAGGDTIAMQIEDGIRNKGIKALVVRVDSPGGSVLASERIRQALLEAKARRFPSSCRWAASPRRAAIGSRPRPTSSTPSRRPSPGRSACSAFMPSFQGTLQKLGVGADGVKTTPLSGEPDLLKGSVARGRPADPERRRIDVRPVPRHRRRIAAQDAAAGRPDRARPRVGRRDRASARPCRRVRRNERRGRQGGLSSPSSATSAASAISNRSAASAIS